MVALTINWTKLAVYLGVAAILLLAGVICGVLFLVAAVVAYGALCVGMKGAAALVFGLGCLPVAGLVVLAAAFWQDHRRGRVQQAMGGQPL
jgi:hypothetical protein